MTENFVDNALPLLYFLRVRKNEVGLTVRVRCPNVPLPRVLSDDFIFVSLNTFNYIAVPVFRRLCRVQAALSEGV